MSGVLKPSGESGGILQQFTASFDDLLILKGAKRSKKMSNQQIDFI
jgi:hypothetical protein